MATVYGGFQDHGYIGGVRTEEGVRTCNDCEHSWRAEKEPTERCIPKGRRAPGFGSTGSKNSVRPAGWN